MQQHKELEKENIIIVWQQHRRRNRKAYTQMQPDILSKLLGQGKYMQMSRLTRKENGMLQVSFFIYCPIV